VEPVKDLPGFNLEFNDLLEPTAARYKKMFKLAGFFKEVCWQKTNMFIDSLFVDSGPGIYCRNIYG
jgi:hypothetical protein